MQIKNDMDIGMFDILNHVLPCIHFYLFFAFKNDGFDKFDIL